MKMIRLICVLAAAAPFSFGASREIVELQRDVANLTDQVQKITTMLAAMQQQLQTLSQQADNSARQSSASLALMQNSLNEAIKRQQEGFSAPLAAASSKVDQMSEDFRNMRETVLDLNTRIGKLDQKVTDLQNALTIMRNPAPPPPGATGTAPAPDAGAAPAPGPGVASGGACTGASADALYSNATRDYMGGSYDIALQEYSDYVKCFNNTQFAPNAQFFIGDILFKKKDYANALQAFDAVLEQYSENNKTAQAHYMKGKTLVAMGKRDAAAKEFREVLSKYPNSDVAPKSRAELSDLGLPSRTGAASRSRSRRK